MFKIFAKIKSLTKTTLKMEGRSWRGFKYNGNRRQAGNGRRLSGMEEHCVEVKVHSDLWCVRSRRRNPIQSLNELKSVCIT